ncbi:MAG: TlpA family protein disulfide reductase, partial [Bacteroidetes bacterium]|nr:TlpA family protein disulfide reductase [Bacteroidota bacterium]
VALPTTIIINRDGEIVYDEVGAKKWDSEEILKQLRSF